MKRIPEEADEEERKPGPAAAGRAGRILVFLVAWLFALGGSQLRAATASSSVLRALPAGASGESGHYEGGARLRAHLLVDAGRATPDLVRVGVLFDLDPGWHLYWRNSGDTGLPTRVHWRVEGGEAGALHWPAPQSFSEADGLFVTFGYEGRVLLASDVTLAPEFDREHRIAVDIDLLICQRECIPARIELERSLTAALVDSPDNASLSRIFDDFEARVPVAPASLGVELESLYDRSALRPGSTFHAAIGARACTTPGECVPWRIAAEGVVFFPAATFPIRAEPAAALPTRDDPHHSLAGFEAEVSEDWEGADESAATSEPRLRGVLVLQDLSGRRAHVDVDLPLPSIDASAQVTLLGEHWLPGVHEDPAGGVAIHSSPSLLEVILLALLGGLILNLMPCVLPVLAIKVFGIAEMAGRDRSALRRSGGAYALGILISMAVLAGAVLALRAAGGQVGWGFQFQSPLFVSAISIVLVTFALNLFGVFEISFDAGGAARLGEQTTGTRRSFFEGLLAVVLATPCSAPFLGTAVGFAFAGSALTIVLIFLCIGAGLAAPFVLISWVPAWSRFVPRSGAWMLKLRSGLGFALLATVVWLLWIAGGLSGTEGMTTLLALLVAIAFGLWIYGMLQHGERTWLRTSAGIALVLLALVGLDLVRARLATATPPLPGESAEGWAAWSPGQVSAALEEGRPVLVAFSAEWCITCKLNETVVLRDSRVLAELERLNVRVLRADWTQRDETIRAELARHGRAGVPLYLVYDPSSPERPQVLPELLSIGVVVDSIRAAAPPTTRDAAS
ncbi:MAG: thioredoxin family protein [Deltaproteobacteria bacterium]|nr:thioredoxin family protein [Deltaproteobacteria bacterium]